MSELVNFNALEHPENHRSRTGQVSHEGEGVETQQLVRNRVEVRPARNGRELMLGGAACLCTIGTAKCRSAASASGLSST